MTAEPARRRRRRPTATSAFGVGRRESHDASGFYARFTPPELSDDDDVRPPLVVDTILTGDARELLADERHVRDNSVALMVTSPPYYAGKAYEEALGTGHIPGTYKDYLAMLRDVFGLVVRKLEPGGRLAVNVANLGRKPYRSLAADVVTILQDDLRLLLRGEIVWQKALGATGSVAWGSFQSPHNPVLRDVTERVIIASKGRFDRAVDRSERERRGLPHRVTIDADRFMDATIDLWELPPESATRVGHPAPFPVGLPQTLIDLYTYEGDLVLDPFMGSGTTAVAAIRTHRHFVGIDTDEAYVQAAQQRCDVELEQRAQRARDGEIRVQVPPRVESTDEHEHPPARATRAGKKAKEVARLLLEHAGFTDIRANERLFTGVTVDFVATDAEGDDWYFDVSGAFASVRSGLRRTDAVWKALGKAALTDEKIPYVLLSSDRPSGTGAAGRALREAHAKGIVFDVLGLAESTTVERLRGYASGGQRGNPPGRLFGG
jgi:site-specific DNA-methyltransferase (adenine-specific)